jgi:Maltogenic Amylase, C-terminal domain
MIHVPNSVPARVFSFVRQNDLEKIFVVINFSGQAQTVTCHEQLFHGTYTEFFSHQSIELRASSELQLEPWGYRIWIR